MEMIVLTSEAADGSQSVQITHNGQTKSFTTEELDAYMNGLANIRENLHPPRLVSQPNPPAEIHAAYDPRWHSQYDPVSNGSVLTICHQAFGWLSYAFPKDSLAALCKHQAEQLQIVLETERTSARN